MTESRKYKNWYKSSYPCAGYRRNRIEYAPLPRPAVLPRFHRRVFVCFFKFDLMYIHTHRRVSLRIPVQIEANFHSSAGQLPCSGGGDKRATSKLGRRGDGGQVPAPGG